MRRDEVRFAVAARDDGLRRVRRLTLRIGAVGVVGSAAIAVEAIRHLLQRGRVHTLGLAIAFVFPCGLSYLMLAVSNNPRMQTLSDDAMRGRVMSFYAMGALGCAPLGALLQGSIANHFGVPAALILGGAFCIAAAVLSYVSLRRQGILR